MMTRIRTGIVYLLVWAMVSVAAVAVVEYYALVGLGLALLGGIGLGVLLFRGRGAE